VTEIIKINKNTVCLCWHVRHWNLAERSTIWTRIV